MRKFDISRVTHNNIILVIGKRATGKSVLVKDILQQNCNTPFTLVVSSTEKNDNFYKDKVPNECIHDEYTPNVIQKFYKRQQAVVEHVEKERNLIGQSLIDPNGILVMENCLYHNSWMEDKNMHTLFMNNKHYHSTIVMTMQFAMVMPPIMHTKLDFVFIYSDNAEQNRKKLYDEYFVNATDSEEFSFADFCQLMDTYTRDYCCLVLDLSSRSKKLEDIVFWYKAVYPNDEILFCGGVTQKKLRT